MRRQRLASLPSLVLAAVLGAMPVAAEQPASKGVSVGDAWTRATPGGATIGAAYLTVAAAKGAGDKLIAAKSDVAERVELHTHLMEGDVMKMRRVESIGVPDGSYVRLKPSGDHIMLIGLKQPLKQGGTVMLTLVFEKAGSIDVEARIEAIGATGPRGLAFQPAPDGSNPDAGSVSGHGHHHH